MLKNSGIGDLFGLKNPLPSPSSSESVVNNHNCCEKNETEIGL